MAHNSKQSQCTTVD